MEYHYNRLHVYEFDSCEYVAIEVGHGVGLAHKGNCKYCEQKRKEERQ